MILLIAYGNDLRGDDGAGLVLAEKLESSWRTEGADVKRLVVHQLLPEMAVELAHPEVETAVFVDARVGGGTPTLSPIGTSIDSTIGHTSSPAVLLAYADDLYYHRPKGWLVTIPAISFEHGTGLSNLSRMAIDFALTQAVQWLKIIQ